MNKKLVQGSVFILLLSLMLFSCSDDELKVGLEILPDTDQFIVKADTISVECFTYKGMTGGAFGTESNSVPYPIGQVYDLVFGETSSEIVMGFAYNTSDYYRPDTIYSDDKALSLKLYMKITEYDSDGSIIDLDLYGGAEGFDIDAFLLNNAVTYSGGTDQSIPSDLYDVNDSRSILTNHSTYINSPDIAQLDSGHTYLVVQFDDELANTFMDSIYLNGDIYDLMPALLLQATSRTGTDGGLQSFMPDSSNTKILLEYTRPDTNGIDTLYSSLDMRRFRCVYRNNHTYRNAEIEPVFRDTLNQSDKFYIQGLGGTRGIVKVNSLIDFKNEKQDSIGVNLAELVIPIHEYNLEDTSQYSLPERIVARGIINTGQYISISDEFLPGYYSNGYLNKSNWEYRINLTEYVNEYMLGNVDYLLLNLSNAMLFGSSSNGVTSYNFDYNTPSRVVLNSGHEGIADKAFIRIVYSKIKE